MTCMLGKEFTVADSNIQGVTWNCHSLGLPYRFPSSALELVVQEQECTTSKVEVTLEVLNAKLDKLTEQVKNIARVSYDAVIKLQ